MFAVQKLVFIVLFMSSTMAWTMEDEESFSNYDSIIAQLQASAEDTPPVPQSDIEWEEVALHGGFGLTTSYVHINSPDGPDGSGLMKGFEAHFGINLFTRKARMEGVFRNYAQEDLSPNLAVDLKEFELRGVYLPPMPDKMRLRLGAGLSARYMDLDSRSISRRKVSTPATSLMIGFERKISSAVTLGPDLSYRSALSSETFDKRSWDASLRLNATF